MQSRFDMEPSPDPEKNKLLMASGSALGSMGRRWVPWFSLNENFALSGLGNVSKEIGASRVIFYWFVGSISFGSANVSKERAVRYEVQRMLSRQLDPSMFHRA